MWQVTGFGQALVNSLTVSILATLLAIAVAIPFAYALDRFRFRAEGWLRQFLLVTQMLSPIVLVIGLFRLVVLLGLVDTTASLVWIYGAFNIAFTVWMLQSYFATIPRDLEEAAWTEGAGPARALWLVFLPLAIPAVTVAAIFSFINAWNEFVIALTILRNQGSYTLPIQIFSLVAGRYTVEWHHVMAAAFVATIPVAIVFAWLQQYLVRGLSLGAVK
jgi:multiple sugar transport system permease protein